MKIKQVKIQAFKSYLEEKDGIFDFSHGNENDVANIVSIYAPNGFGKTSFYDAVDFCITNNVTRYIRDDKVRVKNDKLSKKGSYILRNSKASKSLDTKVDVFTSDNQVFNKVLKRNNSNHRDYLFRDSDTPENKKYFRDLMLSQEAIDAFLRETDPATRYEKFSENHVNELSELNYKRKKIQKILDDINASVKTDNKTKLGKYSELLKVNADGAILTKLGELIAQCNNFGLSITPIQSDFDEAKYKLLKLEIRHLLDTLDQNVIQKNQLKSLYLDFIESFEFIKSSTGAINLEVYDDEFTDGNQIFAFHSDETLVSGDLLEIKCHGISERTFNYLNILLQQTDDESGDPFETQPASVRGNCINQTNPDNYPLGYFRVSETSHIDYLIE